MITNDIVFICDDNYCMPTAVCIQSIKDSIQSVCEIVNIHVCTFGLSEPNVKLLKSMGSDTINVLLDVFDDNIYRKKIEEVKQRSHVTPSALIKFEFANYFKSIDSILYLDSDIIVKSDISELLNINLGDSYLAASCEFWNHIANIEYSLRRNVEKNFYFNSGVMLLNLKKMRDDEISEKLWYYKLYKANSTLMDQESLNAICASTAIHLPIKWNFNPIFLDNRYISEINKVYLTDYKSLDELEDDVCIIHYVGSSDKPWKYKTARMRSYWDSIYNKIFEGLALDLKVAEVSKRSIVVSVIEKIRDHGFTGLLCNMLYHIKMKIGL